MRRWLVSLCSLFCIGLLACPTLAYAWDPFGGVDCSRAAGSAGCPTGPTSDNPVKDTILKVTDIVAITAGIAAVILIIVGALKYVVSGGDSNATSSAKNTILYALIGLVVIVAAKIIISFVISKL